MRKSEARAIILALASVATPLSSVAQEYTFNHDNTIMQQFLVGETGAGSLTPATEYYKVFHKSYYNIANANGKDLYRNYYKLQSLAKEVPMAESIDSSMVERFKVETLNMAERQNVLDIAWQCEGSKITSKLDQYKKLIDQILPMGGTLSDRSWYESKYNCLTTGLEEIRGAYLPMSQRKREYLAIYDDAASQVETLSSLLVYFRTQREAKTISEAQPLRHKVNKADIASNALTRLTTSGYDAVNKAHSSKSTNK